MQYSVGDGQWRKCRNFSRSRRSRLRGGLPTVFAAVFLALVVPLATSAARPSWLLSRDRDTYLVEDNLVYTRALILSRNGHYRQIDRDDRDSREVDRGTWEQDTSGSLRLRGTAGALRPRVLRAGVLTIPVIVDSLPTLMTLAGAAKKMLDHGPDAVFGPASIAELNTAGGALVALDDGAPTFDRPDLECLVSELDSLASEIRSGVSILWPVRSAPTPVFRTRTSPYRDSDYLAVRKQYRAGSAAPAPFYFAAVSPAAFAAAAGQWREFGLPGGVD